MSIGSALAQRGQEGGHRLHDAQHVHRERVLPVADGVLRERTDAREHAGVRAQHVHAARPRSDLLHRRVERRDGRHVEADPERAPARGSDLRGHRLGARLLDVGDGHRHALGAEGSRDAAPDPATAPRHDGDAAVQIAHRQGSVLLPQLGIVPRAIERLLAAAERRELRHAEDFHGLSVAEIVDREPLERLREGPARVAQDDR